MSGSPRRHRRDALWLLAASGIVALLVAAGSMLRGSEREARDAAVRELHSRVEISAALTDSVFKAVGALSNEQLTQLYGGGDLDRALRQAARRPGGTTQNRPVFLAIVDERGRRLAGRGPAPARFPLAAGATEAQMSGVLPAGDTRALQFIVPFAARDGSRRAVVQGLAVPLIQAFLGDFLARLPRPDAAHLTVTDGTGVVLARGRARRPAGPGEAEIVTSTRVPGTLWHMTLAAPRSQVFAGVDARRQVPWLLLAALAAAGLAGLWLSRRLDLAVRRARAVSSQLGDSREELQNLIASLEEGVAHRDADGRVHLLNDSAHRLLNTDADVVHECDTPWRVLDELGNELDPAANPTLLAASGEPVSGMVVGLDGADGTRRWLRVSARPLAGEGGTAPHPVVVSFSDVTAQRELELHLTRLAECDPLTGLMNRRRFELDLATQVARSRRYEEQAALVLLDIDSFKAINDSLGHVAGDEVLRTVADGLRERLRAGDVAGRLGGDEFAILLTHVGLADARAIARDFTDRIQEAIRGRLDGLTVRVTFGVALVDADSATAEAVLDASDRDMYDNKPMRALIPEPGLRPALPGAAGEDRPQALSALMAAVRARDAYTASHSLDVVTLARAVAVRLGVTGEDLVEVEHVALVHDIGKIAVPDAILRKPGRLTADEETIMRQHPIVGGQIVASVPALSHLGPAIRAEHERWDGAGYPDGLAGEAIPLASRIVFVCDAYHAMTSDRPYRQALPESDARYELRLHAGTQFCPAAVDALLAVLAAADDAKRATGIEPATSSLGSLRSTN